MEMHFCWGNIIPDGRNVAGIDIFIRLEIVRDIQNKAVVFGN
jgi:hypothetical protein